MGWRGGGGGTAKNIQSSLSTSGRCTQGSLATQTEIKSWEDGGSGVSVCVCVYMCVLAPSSGMSVYLTTTIYYTAAHLHVTHGADGWAVKSHSRVL